MDISVSQFNPDTDRIQGLFEDLFPICRSLTGPGNRETLRRLSDETSLNIREIDSRTQVYDWEVPPEWCISAAYIEDSDGDTVVDFEDNNLHVLNYSVPVDREVSFEELQEHLYTLPEMPDAIPYRTSYYERDWGFCLRYETFEALDEDETYHVYIDSELDPSGSLTYADAIVDGPSNSEFIISTYCCHPSMANDNLSGPILATLLFDRLRDIDTYHSYRLVIVPETIGSIAYLHENEAVMKSVDGGYVITTVAGPGTLDYKKSFEGDTHVDIAARRALSDHEYDEHEFVPDGSDERQYSTPGFRIPTGTIAKDKYYEYTEYHTSNDNLSFVSAANLAETFGIYWDAIQLLEMNRTYERVNPHCEFKLDQYDLYPTTGGIQKQSGYLGDQDHAEYEYQLTDDDVSSGEMMDAIRWLMFGCDGATTIFDLAERSDMTVKLLFSAARRLEDAGLLTEVQT